MNQEYYQSWLNSLKSSSTKREYSKNVNRYCLMVLGKEPIKITREDLINLKYNDTIDKYITPAKEKGNKDSTMKAVLASMRSFIDFLERVKAFDGVDYSYLQKYVLRVDSLTARDTKHHEAISIEELEKFKEWIINASRNKVKGEKYAQLVDFMFSTAIRVSATFEIKWSDFTIESSPYGGTWAMLDVIDKGRKLNTKSLPVDYYMHMKDLLFDGELNDTVFKDLSQVTLRKYFTKYSDERGLSLTPHSLKAGAATTVYARTKDIIMVRDFCDHESVATTERYIHQQQNPNQTGTSVLTAHYNYDDLNNLSTKEFNQILNSNEELRRQFFVCGIQNGILNA